MTYEHILYEVEDGRARITLNRPEKHNAITSLMQHELNVALWDADDDLDVHSIILKGAGRSFCAGYDLSGGGYGVDRGPDKRYRTGRTIDDDSWFLEQGLRARMALFDIHKPVIAQVHGNCIAGGTDLAFLCDMVIVADDARIGFPPARDLGALPNNMWVYLAGPQWAKRLLLTGDTVTGAEAADLGLAMKAVPHEHLEPEVEQLADRLALIDPDLLSSNKRICNIALELMGARTLQRLAAENDARAHRALGADVFRANVAEKGLKAALVERDSKFGDGRARVKGFELRDADGRLVDR